MKILLLFAALLWATGAQAQVYEPPEINLPLQGTIAPSMLVCRTLTQLHSIMAVTGPHAIERRFDQINAGSPPEKPACWNVELHPTMAALFQPIEHYELVEITQNMLYDLVVVEVDFKDGDKDFGVLQRFAGPGRGL